MTKRQTNLLGLALGAALGGTLSMPVLAAEAPGVGDDTIRIAVEDVLAGPYAQYGVPSLHGVMYVFDKVNAAGGVHGRKLEVVPVDGGCAPKDTVGAATRLASEGEVLAVLGLTCSSGAVAVKDSVAPTTAIPFISFSSGGWTSNAAELGGVKPNFFFVASSVHTQGGALVNFVMNELKPERVAFIGQTDIYGKEGLQGVEAVLKEYGKELVATETMEARSTDASAQVLKLKQAEPDVVIAFLYQIPAQMLLRQANDLGLKAAIVTSASVTDSAIYESLPPAALADYYGSTLGTDVLEGARMAGTVAALEAAYPDVTFNPLVASGIGGAEALVAALEAVGPEVTAEALVAELDKLTGFETSALAYPLSFTPEDHMAGEGVQIYRVEDGVMTSTMEGYWPGNEKAAAPR